MLSFFWGVCRKRQNINFIDTIPLLINTIAPKSMESPGYLKATWVSVQCLGTETFGAVAKETVGVKST